MSYDDGFMPVQTVRGALARWSEVRGKGRHAWALGRVRTGECGGWMLVGSLVLRH